MFISPFACGNFSNQEEDDLIDELLSPCTTPKRSRKRSDSKNPYSTRGLDKFSALLAELEDKKQKIYTQKGSEDISFVRFVYSNSNDWKPIVVKTKDRKPERNNHVDNVKDKKMTHNSQVQDKHTIEASNVVNEIRQQKEELSRRSKKTSIKWGFKLKNLRHPCFYLPIMMVLILLFLAMYGRSFAILCTSLGWYIVPMIKERRSRSSENTEKKKKDYVRRLSEKNMVNDGSSNPKSHGSSSPKSVLNGPSEKTTGQHAHRKSW
ncbi:hypothetical protein ACH5RR_034956 [Cinchona calisaya]|uniref:ZCF37 n=1 Tax=Cinchona calisaya TaxID=153742 RepID=A0ABD2YCV8_9GENT